MVWKETEQHETIGTKNEDRMITMVSMEREQKDEAKWWQVVSNHITDAHRCTQENKEK